MSTTFDDYTMNNNTESFISMIMILAPLVFIFLVLNFFEKALFFFWKNNDFDGSGG